MQSKSLSGEKIKLARTAQGIRNWEVTEQLGDYGIKLSESGLSHIERGKRAVLDFELPAFADILHVTVDWLLGKTEPSRTAGAKKSAGK